MQPRQFGSTPRVATILDRRTDRRSELTRTSLTNEMGQTVPSTIRNTPPIIVSPQRTPICDTRLRAGLLQRWEKGKNSDSIQGS